MEEEDLNCDGYDLEIVPVKASKENKTGITLKGKDGDYLEAHRILKNMTQTKGDQYVINGVEVGILDAPKNKPINIAIKPKFGLTGKANLKIYEMNGRGGATIFISRVSGGNFGHVETLGLKVIKYLFDGLIKGSIKEEDIEGKFKKKDVKTSTEKLAKVATCTKCDKTFQNAQGLKIHIKRKHVKDESSCNYCDKAFKEEKNVEEHIKTEHIDTKSPSPKKRKQCEDVKMVETEDEEEKDTSKDILESTSWEEKRLEHRETEIKINDIEISSMEDYSQNTKEAEINRKIEEDFKEREALNDLKVLKKQTAWFEAEVKFQELKKKALEDQMKEEKKRKRQASVGKKKKKSKEKKEKSLETGVENVPENVKVIDKSLDDRFVEAGLKRDDHRIFKVKADGACASNSVAAHCHGDSNLGPYVRRNVNDYICKNWKHFQQFITFPLTETAGSTNFTFENENEYLNFLKNDSRSGKLWANHEVLQVVANMYNIKIHILTTHIPSNKGVISRWTHLVPDRRLESGHQNRSFMLNDMWLIHENNTHFDLIVRKDSILSQKDGLFQRNCEKGDNKSEINVEMKEHVEQDHFGYDCDECKYKAITEKDLETHTDMKHSKQNVGPGYMGWKMDEENVNIQNESKESEDSALRKEIKELKEVVKNLVDNIQNIKKDTTKEMNQLKNETKSLKKDFKECMEVLYKETYEKNRIETTLKVLQENIEAEKELKNFSKETVESNTKEKDIESDGNMSVDEEDGWKRQKRTIRNKMRGQRSDFKCNICSISFKMEDELLKHIGMNHGNERKRYLFNCENCEFKADTENEIKKHLFQEHESESVRDQCMHESNKQHQLEYNCNKCEYESQIENEFKKHVQQKHVDQKFSCNKCDKEYNTMAKLRRHDWRSHRQIECNICGKSIESRQEIKNHRQTEHKMFKTVFCKFFPDCLDEDECLFEHGKNDTIKDGVEVCSQGRKCNDQSCKYSEQQHVQVK